MMGFFTTPKVAFGPGAIEQLAGLEPHRVAVVRTPSVAALDGARRVEEFARTLGAELAVHTVRAAPPTVIGAELLANEIGPTFDAWVAIGGGGLLDLAKAARARVARPDVPLADWTPLTDIPSNGVPRLVALPTTAGSGSEMTGSAHLLTADGGTFELSHRGLAPDWAFLDPALVRSVPSELAVAHGFEVVAHALEALASEWANPFADALARDSLAVALATLPRLARQPHDPEARTALYYAASRAGLATANSSLGLAHAFARALMPELPTVGYARLLGIALPPTVDYNFPSARDRYEGIVPLFPAAPGAMMSSFAERVRSLVRTLGLPTDLAATRVDLSSLPSHREAVIDRVRRSTASIANPRVPSLGELGRLYDLVERPTGAASS